MRRYLRFLAVGLVLGLFTEAQLKLVAGINPPALLIALVVYPVLLSLSYALSVALDRLVSSTWRGDLLHYGPVGVFGLAFEWLVLGNGPASNAFQPGMFAMWTTYGFGPRVLTRSSPAIDRAKRSFWIAFALVALLLTAAILLTPAPKAGLVIAVIGLSASYGLWSLWLLALGWKSRSAAGKGDRSVSPAS